MPPKSKPLPKGKSMVRCRSFDAEGRPIDGGCRFGDSCHFLHPPWPEESVRKRRSVTPEEQRRRRESRYNTPPMDNYDRRPGARSRSRSRSPLRSARPRPHPRPRTPPPPRRVYRGRSRSPPRLRPRSRSRSRSRNSSPHSRSRFDRRKSRSRSRSRSRSPPPRRTTTTVDRLRDRDWDRDRDRDQLRAGRMAPDIKPWQRERSHQRASSTLTTSSVHSVRSEESNTNRTSSKSTTMPTSVPVSLPASASVSVSPSTSATIPVPVSIPVPAKPKQSGDSDVMMEEGEVAVTPRGWTRSSLPSSSSSTARKIANTNKNSSVSATASASATATRTKSTTTPRTTTTTIATLPSSSSGATAIPVSTGSVPPLPPLAEVVKQQQEQKQEQQQQLTSTSISVDTDEEMEVAQNLYDNDNDSDRNSNPQVLPLAPISRTGEDKNLVLQRIRAGGDDAGAVVDARLRFQTGGTTTQELSDVEKRFIHAVWDRRVHALMEIGRLNAKKEEVTSLLETMARARSTPGGGGGDGLDQRDYKLVEVKKEIERMLKEVMDRLRREERGLEEEALRLYVGDGASATGGNRVEGGGGVVARLENARVRLDELTRRVWPDRQRQLQLQQNQRRQLTADVGLTSVTTAAVTKSTTMSGTVTPKAEGEEGEEMEVEEEEEEEEEAEITEAELEVLEEKMMDLGLDFDDIEYGVEGNVMVQSLVEKEVARLARLNKLKPGDVSAQGNTVRGASKEEMEEIVGLELEVKVDEEWDKEAQVQLEEVRRYVRRLEERTERARRELDQEKESLRVMKEKVEAAEKRLEALEREQGQQHQPMTESELHVQATQLMVSAATLIEREWQQKLEGVREDIHVSASEAMEEAKRIMERVRKEEMERWEGKEGREGERGDEVRILEKVAGSLQGTLVWQNAVAEYLNGLAIASAGVGSGPGPGPGASVGANETEGAHSLGQPRARV